MRKYNVGKRRILEREGKTIDYVARARSWAVTGCQILCIRWFSWIYARLFLLRFFIRIGGVSFSFPPWPGLPPGQGKTQWWKLTWEKTLAYQCQKWTVANFQWHDLGCIDVHFSGENSFWSNACVGKHFSINIHIDSFCFCRRHAITLYHIPLNYACQILRNCH